MLISAGQWRHVVLAFFIDLSVLVYCFCKKILENEDYH